MYEKCTTEMDQLLTQPFRKRLGQKQPFLDNLLDNLLEKRLNQNLQKRTQPLKIRPQALAKLAELFKRLL